MSYLQLLCLLKLLNGKATDIHLIAEKQFLK